MKKLEYEIDYNLIGKRLRGERKRLELRQDEMAHLMGVTPKYVSRLENGTAKPSLTYIMKFSDICQASLDYLLCRDFKHQSKEGFQNGSEYEGEWEKLDERQRSIINRMTRALIEALGEDQQKPEKYRG